MKKCRLKVMTILGTRPEIVRLARVVPKLDECFNHIFVYTNQSYDFNLSGIFFRDFGLRKPDYVLSVKSNTLGGQVANIISQTEKVLIKEMPDALLVLGDTNSALSAIIARRMKIPIFHMEAGNRTYNWDVPEEVNRRIVDHISNINLPYTEHARRYLISENIPADKIFVTGSPVREVVEYYKQQIDSSKILDKLKIKPQKYFVVSTHREENIDKPEKLTEIIGFLNLLAKTYKLPVIVTLHPRTKLRVDKLKVEISPLVRFEQPFGFFDYNKLQKNSLCVISDSGTIQEESSMQGFDAVHVRDCTERPEAVDSGTITVVGVNKKYILDAVNMLVNQKEGDKNHNLPRDYSDINVSTKVAKIILGWASIFKLKK